MYRPRVIPVLLLHNKGIVKTIKFSHPRYIGDPINTVRIFNEKEVDELILLDIDASVQRKAPDFDLIEEIVGEAFMPIGYGGGVKTLEQMHRLFRAGIEKVSLSSAAIENPSLVRQASMEFGRQAVVVTLDIKRLNEKYVVSTYNDTQIIDKDPVDVAQEMEALGAGELILNFVDRDGTMQGYDVQYVRKITHKVKIPVIALGGAGSLLDLRKVVFEGGASAAAAGSLFVYYGRLRAVLINYPSQEELTSLFRLAGGGNETR